MSHTVKAFHCMSNLLRNSQFRINYSSNQYLIITARSHKRWVSPVRMIMRARKEKMDPQPPQPRNTYPEWNYNAELFAFGQRLGENFNRDFLQRAFVMRSYIIMEEEKQKKVGIEEPNIVLKDNKEYVEKGERMITEYCRRYLRKVFPSFPEEGICSICDYLLNNDILADISKNIGTSDLIMTSEHPPSNENLADIMKAVVFALAQSSGSDRANLFIRDFIITYLSGKDINELWEIENPEIALDSILQKEGRSNAEPRLIAETGKTTIMAAFQVALYSDKTFIGKGFGESVSVAKEVAARDALKRLFHTTEYATPIPFDLELSADTEEPFANLSIQDWCTKNLKTLSTN